MKLLSPERATQQRSIAMAVQQRWRWAALGGLLIFLALAGYALAVAGSARANSPRPVSILAAATDIRAGTTISDSMLRVTSISTQDSRHVTGTTAAISCIR